MIEAIKKFISTKRGKMILVTVACVILMIMLAVVVIAWNGSTSDKNATETEATTQEPTTQEMTTPERPSETETPEPEEDRTGQAISPLTGLWVPEQVADNRPVAVMLNNIIDAVPQAGIASADIVYECPVEGGITRLMGIFQDFESLSKIGSVRSCRLYYAHIALDYDAVYVHIGQSKYALNFLNSSDIDNLNAENYNGVAFRTNDRYAPHNAYVSGEGVLHGEDILGYSDTIQDSYDCPLTFLPYDEERELQGVSALYVEPGFSYNDPYFQYDEKTKLYQRFQFGERQIDELTGESLLYKNLIIQYVDSVFQDDEYTWDLVMTGSGSGKYITNGKMVDITWSRSSIYDTTVFYDENGKELLLNPGKTWVTVMQHSNASQLITR